jgi:dolichol-phosphate mannosyltransferase
MATHRQLTGEYRLKSSVQRPFVLVPTYNERENLRDLAQDVLDLSVDGLHLVIIDDNSPDGTGELADELSASAPDKMTVVHRSGKNGLGRAYLAGIGFALGNGADAIVEMDADFSHNPSDIPGLLAGLQTCDLVIGSRYVAGGSIDADWSWSRRALSRCGGGYARLILGLPIHDPTSGFRAYSRRALEAVDLAAVRSSGYAFQVEMAYAVHRLGYRLGEIPIHFRERANGRSKMSMSIALEAAWRTWQLRFQI